jgi:hypothetical protein
MTKTSKCVCNSEHGSRPAWASTQSDQDPCCLLSVSLLVKGFVSKQHGSRSDCADAQAGLDPCWSLTYYVGFVMSQLIYMRELTLSIVNEQVRSAETIIEAAALSNSPQ